MFIRRIKFKSIFIITIFLLSLGEQERFVGKKLAWGSSGQTTDEGEKFESLRAALKIRPESIELGNQLRKYCRDKNEFDQCVSEFEKLLKEFPDQNAIRYNAALAYVDKIPGHSLLKQGWLSTRSINLVSTIIEKYPSDWLALFIRGMNNLYWPAWFRRTGKAIDDFERCLEISKKLPSDEIRPYHALAYVALGDALVKSGDIQKARLMWQQGLKINPSGLLLGARLNLTDAELVNYVDEVRDLNNPIDTDLSFLWQQYSFFEIFLVGGHLYGPGPLSDQELAPGKLKSLMLDTVSYLKGTIEPFNNQGEEPNIPGEILQGRIIDGRLSDGTLINENIDVGHVKLMSGKFDLLLAAVYGGPHKGLINFYLDPDWNWTIQDDIAMDPGFASGVIKLNNFIFSTGPRQIPFSMQTTRGYPGGVDRSGSLRSGQVLLGRLGDDNFDGYLDGVFNAVGSFPSTSIFLPGAPFAQTRIFESNIPIKAFKAAFLSTASARNYLKKAFELSTNPELIADVEMLVSETNVRLAVANRHIEKTLEDSYSEELNVLKNEMLILNQELKKNVPNIKLENYRKKIEQMLTALYSSI